MKLIFVAYKYLRNYPLLSLVVLFSIVAASFFEGASFGMLIPLIQSMTNASNNILTNIPLIKNFAFVSLQIDQQKTMTFLIVFLFFLILIKNVFMYLSTVLIAKLRYGIIRDLNAKLMNSLIEYDVAYFDNVKSGYLINILNTETARMGSFILGVLQFISLLGKVAAYIILLFLISFRASAIIFGLIIVVLTPLEFIMQKLKKLGAKVSQATAEYNYKLVEIFGGMRLIKTCGTEELEKGNFKGTVDEIFELCYKSLRYISLLMPLSEVLIFGLTVACFIVLIHIMRIDLANIFPYIATYLVVLVRTLAQLNTLNSHRSQAVNSLAAFTYYEEAYDKRSKGTIKSGAEIIDKLSDSIEFVNVEFSYADNKKILTDINVRVPKGRITAIVGASGAGKSTMINLISRFYDVKSGAILIDGISLKDLDIKRWRKKIGLVSQDTFIFNTTVRKNVSYGHEDVEEERIVEAAKKAFAHDFIMELPNGYDTVLGERGVKLSGGQKQRISIARAVICNPEILILDEATSSLDTATEKLIREAIDRLTKDRTVIAIAHRLSTILHADNIIVLNEGRIVEVGNHHDLIKKNGFYKKLYEIQFSA